MSENLKNSAAAGDLDQRIAALSPEKRALLALRLKQQGRASNTFPLSFAQQRFWFLNQLNADSLYNVANALRLRGRLDLDALQRTLTEIHRRHEVLRTTFATVDGQPVQVISPASTVTLPLVDLSGVPESRRRVEAERLAAVEGMVPFDLARGPMLRSTVLRLGEEDHVVLWTMHHIVSDGWSTGVLVREVVTLYKAYSSGEPSPLPELPIQYADYAAWQRKHMQGEVLEEQLSYWRGQLEGAPAVLNLPTDRPRPTVQSFRGGGELHLIPASQLDALKELSLRNHVTLFMTLLAGFQAVLHRYSGQDDIVVGFNIAGRSRSETELLIGSFVNTLVLRSKLGSDLTFRELLGRAREVTLGAYAHQELPFEKLVEELHPERDLSHSPLFQVMFVLDNEPQETLELPGLELSPLNTGRAMSKFDITISMLDTQRGLAISAEYNADIFEPETIRCLLRHYQNVLVGAAANPDRRLSELPLLTEEERREQLVEWNDTRRDYPSDALIHQLFERQADARPESPAVAGPGDALTYGELERRANQLAHHLRAMGVGPGVFVGITAERAPETLVGLLGILKAGGAYVPLSPAYPLELLSFMFEDARLPILLTTERLEAELPSFWGQTVYLDADADELARQSAERPAVEASPEHPAYAIYTSGSTGRPKGVVVTHRNLVHSTAARLDYYGEAPENYLLLPTFAFDSSVGVIFGTLCAGGKLTIPAEEGHRDVDYLAGLIERERVTHCLGVPALYDLLLRYGRPGQLNSLKKVVVAGEACTRDLVERHQRLLPVTELFNEYGPTEAAVWCSVYRCVSDPEAAQVPIGTPIANARLYVLDARGHLLPRGAKGELYVGGEGIAEGYLNRPGMTAERFVPDSFSGEPGARLYRTGDFARYLPDGEIEFLGRADEQVKVRGYRIELGAVEAALALDPEVLECAVLPHEDAGGERRLVAYLLPREGSEPTAAEVRARLKQRLPEYMIPSAFIVLDEMPRTPHGKVDRQALPALDFSRAESGAGYVAPRTPAEKLLAEIWADVLKVERVGVEDNFFDLGGDSILSIQIIARANQSGLHLTTRQMFQRQTIAELAQAAAAAPVVESEQGMVSGPAPLTPIQHWFFEEILTAPQHWNMALMFELRGGGSPEHWERAAERVLSHHDALRMRFVRDAEGWAQVNETTFVETPFQRHNLSSLPAAERRAEVERHAAALQKDFDLGVAPLVRLAYFDLGPEEPPRLLIVAHHLVVDGVSWRILLDDLESAYRQAEAGQHISLPTKTTSYKAFAHSLREYATGGECASELTYWASDARRAVGALPRDFEAGRNTVASTSGVSVSLSAEETEELLQRVPPVYRTEINDVLLTALALAFERWGSVRRLLVDLEAHGREEFLEGIDLSRTVGWFTSIYPLLLELPMPTGNVGAALKGIKEQLRAVPQKGVGYGVLRYLGDERARAELSGMPRAEVSFNYLGQLDKALAGDSAFARAPEATGPDCDPGGERQHALEVLGSVADGQLNLTFVYSEHLHRRASVEGLAAKMAGALRDIIGHCRSAGAGGVTPSDFSAAKLSQKELDKILTRMKKSGEK